MMPRLRAARATSSAIQREEDDRRPSVDTTYDAVVLVDERDCEIGVMQKLDAHRQGRSHRAISVLVRDSSSSSAPSASIIPEDCGRTRVAVILVPASMPDVPP